jgi:glycosyltransferase involved in cell wall biosynthesis
VEYLIRAAEMVRRELPGSRLKIILADDPSDHYARVLAEVGARVLADHVTVLLSVPRAELPRHLMAADCILVPSVSKGSVTPPSRRRRWAGR